MTGRNRHLFWLLPIFVATAVAAQTYPARSIRYIIPFAPGGGSDLQGRILASEMSADLDQPVVVENRPGASGLIGLATLTGSPPDGYTLSDRKINDLPPTSRSNME